MKTAPNHLFNLALLLTFLGLLVFPVLTGQLLLGEPLEKGSVAGIKTPSLNRVSILPNLLDFNGYASFTHLVKNTLSYQDQLTLTVFTGQIANYRNLYSIYNTNTLPILLKAELFSLGNFELSENQLQIDSGQESLTGNPLLIRIDKGQKAAVSVTVAPKDKKEKDLQANFLFKLDLSP